jgi:hypothetical protein
MCECDTGEVQMKGRFLIGLLVAMIVLFAVRCSASDPESVARAYQNALLAKDCDKAGTYVAPDVRADTLWTHARFCGPEAYKEIRSIRVDEAVVRDGVFLLSTVGKEVTFVGEIVLYSDYLGYELEDDTWSVFLEQLDGKWYVRSGPR